MRVHATAMRVCAAGAPTSWSGAPIARGGPLSLEAPSGPPDAGGGPCSEAAGPPLSSAAPSELRVGPLARGGPLSCALSRALCTG